MDRDSICRKEDPERVSKYGTSRQEILRLGLTGSGVESTRMRVSGKWSRSAMRSSSYATCASKHQVISPIPSTPKVIDEAHIGILVGRSPKHPHTPGYKSEGQQSGSVIAAIRQKLR